MTLLLASLIKASIVLALALVATLLLRRRSAALRHAILAIAIVCAVVMPALEWAVPSLPIIPWGETTTVQSSGATLTSDVATVAIVTTADNTAEATPVSWLQIAGLVWVSASALAFGSLMLGFLRLARLRRHSVPVTGRRRDEATALARSCGVHRPVVLLQSRTHTQPVTYGVTTPGIILPADATSWSDARWHIVLRHELAHIARCDAALQITSEVLRILQPLNPLVWLACRRLRQESEYACDDAVLGSGVRPTEYATHLLDVAKHLSGRQISMAAAPAIAHPSTLERRIVAMLQNTKNRTPLTRRGWAAATLAALSLSLPLAAAGLAPAVVVIPEPQVAPAPTPAPATPVAAVTPPVAATPAATPTPAPRPAPVTPAAPRQAGSIAGQVVDQTGGTIPGATITLVDKQTSQASTAITDPAGRFAFRDLTAGDYELSGRLSGFAPFAASFTVTPGATMNPRFTLAVGTLTETITVVCGPEEFSLLGALFPVLHAQQPPSTPIRVGGQIREPKKIRDVRPTCPAAGVSSEVLVTLTGTIDATGELISAAIDDDAAVPPADLADIALNAMRQWRFTPTQLNGQPIAVGIKVNVTFRPR